MYRSLAFVGILSISAFLLNGQAMGGEVFLEPLESVEPVESVKPAESLTTVSIKNHMSDTERDRLMHEAMDKARKKLDDKDYEKQKELEQKADTEQRKKEYEKQATQAREESRKSANAEADDAKKKSAKSEADKKADEIRLATQLAEAEKNASQKSETTRREKQDSVKDLDKVKSNSSNGSDEKSISKKTRNDSKDNDSSSNKTVIETASTNVPGAGLSVKARAPENESANKDSNDNSENDRSQSVSGQVIGIMRSSNGQPRILVSTRDRRMVQVILEDSDADVPAPGAVVSVRGRDMSTGQGQRVVSADSISLETGSYVENPQRAAKPEQLNQPMPIPAGPMIPPPGVMPRPPMPMMPMMAGPFPPPPRF